MEALCETGTKAEEIEDRAGERDGERGYLIDVLAFSLPCQ